MNQNSKILFFLLDLFWKPRWKKEGLATLKGGQKFLHYKRDLIEQGRIDEIESRLKDMRLAIKSRKQDAVKEAGKQLQGTCEHSLKGYRAPDAVADNLEVFFVAIAVALGIRAYYVQPFRIPTGSMQPTLNGIIGEQVSLENKDWKKPNIITRGVHKLTEGRTYIKAVAPADTEISQIEDDRFLWFFTRTIIHFENGQKIKINGSSNAVINGLGLGENMNFYATPSPNGIFYSFEPYEVAVQAAARGRISNPRRFPVKKGQILAQGHVDTGDLVLVDKFSYHFRKPKRGEVFVFETRGIKQIQSDAKSADQNAGSHYIKRLAGVPGDTLRLDRPNLWHNGKLATEKGFKDVASGKNGYRGYVFPSPSQGRFLRNSTETFTLKEDKYFAMGDNSENSSDSRYWGDIDEYLLVGPGLFTLWPFENFGPIR